MNLTPVSVKQQVRNFAITQECPFSIAYTVEETGLNKDTVRKYLRDMENEGILRRVRQRNNHRNFYAIQRKKAETASAKTRNTLMRYNLNHVSSIIDAIKNNRCSTLLQIGAIIGKTKQFCYTYMIALASAGVVGFDGCYYIKDELLTSKIGKDVDPYILQKMRKSVKELKDARIRMIKALKMVIRYKEKQRKLKIAKKLAGKGEYNGKQ